MLQSNPTLSDMKQEIDNKLSKSENISISNKISTSSGNAEGSICINVDGTTTEQNPNQKPALFTAERTDTSNIINFGISTDGLNAGIYSNKLGDWLVNVNENGGAHFAGIHYAEFNTNSVVSGVTSLTTGELLFLYE